MNFENDQYTTYFIYWKSEWYFWVSFQWRTL